MYDVRWLESAVRQLAESWIRADSVFRAAITAASHRVDEALKTSPLQAGESRYNDERRILIEPPLVVVFEVDIVSRKVTVLRAFVPPSRGQT